MNSYDYTHVIIDKINMENIVRSFPGSIFRFFQKFQNRLLDTIEKILMTVKANIKSWDTCLAAFWVKTMLILNIKNLMSNFYCKYKKRTQEKIWQYFPY